MIYLFLRLISGTCEKNEPVHVVIALNPDIVCCMIAVYRSAACKWERDFEVRKEAQFMTNCFRCKGGSTASKSKTHVATLENCVIIVKNVPAVVCQQCGEAYFTDNVMQNVEIIINKLENIAKEVAIVEYTDSAA